MADGEIRPIAGFPDRGSKGREHKNKKRTPPPVTASAGNMPRDVFIRRETGRVSPPSYGDDPRLKALMAQHRHRNKK